MLPLAIPAIAQLGTSVIGAVSAAKNRKAAQKAQQEALKILSSVQGPDVEQLKLQLEELTQQGQITPEEQQAILQQQSEMSGISTDPRLKSAQMSALNSLLSQGEGGLTAEDRLALGDVRRDVSRDARGRDEAIIQQMAMRGQGGAGAELAARLSNAQAATERSSQEGDRIAAMAQQRALQALAQGGTLATGLRNQEFGEQSDVARAQDAINAFNIQNRRAVEDANVGARNQAQRLNLEEKQRIADTNVGSRNAQQKYNKELLVDDFNRRLGQAERQANVLTGQAKNERENMQAKQQLWSGIGQGVGQIGTTIVGALSGGSAAGGAGTGSIGNKYDPKI